MTDAVPQSSECPYCGAVNGADEHRCVRCGRRLGEQNALAPSRGAGPIIALPRREGQPPRIPQQPSLFRVIPFEAITPPAPAKDASASPLPRRNAGRSPDPNQPALPFIDVTPAPSRPVPLCHGRVAPLGARLEAACFDVAMTMLGAGVFFGVSRWAVGDLAWSRPALAFNAAALALIVVFYRLLGCLLSDRSPGMRVAGIKLLRFDGGAPSRGRRLWRVAASLFSLLPAGLGFIWALLDEEGLSFHDHISETFPSS